ncbi:MAG: DUF6056 family protein [Bacilli bacterium]
MLNKNKNKICFFVIIAFIITLIPLFILSFYNHPSNDDFYYGSKTYHTYQETGSILNTLSSAVDQVKETYINWQGTYSAVFLFSLQPAIFSENVYWIGTFILLFSLIITTLFLSFVLLKKYCHSSTVMWLLVSIPILFLEIQLLVSPLQGFYWWNGSIYYLFFYCLSLILYALLLLYLKSSNKIKNGFYLIISFILAFIIGGGNYVTALITAILLFFLTIYTFFKKRNKALPCLLLLLFFLGCFAISITAPGNAVRALSYPSSPSPILAILESFYFAFHFIGKWTNLTIIFFMFLLSLGFYKIVNNTKLSFKYPLLVLIISFGIFAACFTPPCYAMGSFGADRILNIIYFSYYWFLIINTFYFIGWLKNKKIKFIDTSYDKIMKSKKSCCYLLILTGFFLFLPLTSIEDLTTWQGKPYTSINAIYSLTTSEASRYNQECLKRIESFQNKELKNVVLNPFTVHPYSLYYSDLTGDKDYQWSNDPIRKYYDKESVIVNWDR